MIPVTAPAHRGVLLDLRDVIAIQRPTGAEDAHGWVLNAADGGAVEVAVVRGSVQWSMPRSENSMTTSGNGPHDPALTRTATAYLPADCGVRAGDFLTVEGHPTVVVRSWMQVLDPRPSGDLDCVQCQVEEVTIS